jgi:hypothetical protein
MIQAERFILILIPVGRSENYSNVILAPSDCNGRGLEYTAVRSKPTLLSRNKRIGTLSFMGFIYTLQPIYPLFRVTKTDQFSELRRNWNLYFINFIIHNITKCYNI